MRHLLAQVDPGLPIEELEAAELITPNIDWYAVSVHLILMVGGVLVLTVASLWRKHPDWFAPMATVAIAVAGFVMAVFQWQTLDTDGPRSVIAGAVALDGFSIYLSGVMCAALVLIAPLLAGYLDREDLVSTEPYVLMLLSASGGTVMAAANDLVVLFVGLEILSIAVYVLAAMHRRRARSQEAGLKYFVLGAFSSAFFLYGMAFIYGATSSTSLVDINAFLARNTLLDDRFLLAGMALMLVGFGFKVAAVPFHSWTPDVYQGAPSPVSAFMASVVKAAAFAGLLRVFYVTFGGYAADWQPVIYALSIASLVVGSVMALVQTDVKRLLAYSSITHAGFLLVGVETATERGTAAVLFYLLCYTFMVIGSFAAATLIGRAGDGHHSLEDLKGLSRTHPALAMLFTVFLLAQAGIPLTSGFVAKFYVIGAAVEAEEYPLAAIAMLAAVVGVFLYLRIIVGMYFDGETYGEDLPANPARLNLPMPSMLMLGAAVIITVLIGVVPGPVIDVARDAVPVLVAG